MKILSLLVVLLITVNTLTDKEIIQQGLNGFFEANTLPDPTTIVACLDDDTAHRVVAFMGEVLDKAATGSISDLINLVSTVQKFLESIPEPVQKCLDNNKEAEALGLKYGITPTTDPNSIIKKLVTYATLHYLQVHKWFVAENDLWTSGKYYQTGFDGAGYLHTVLGGSVEIPNISDKETIQQMLNGVFEQNKMTDPTTIVPCIDDDTAHKIVVFIGQLLEKAGKGSIQDLISLKSLVENFGKEIPQAVKDCLDGNKQLEALGVKYGITPDSNSSAIQKKVIAFVTLHYLEVHKTLGEANSQWKAAKPYDTGKTLATLAHKALGSPAVPNISDKEIIQQNLNGLFEENQLSDPTTIVTCLDDDTAHKMVVFSTQLLDLAAKGAISDAPKVIQLIRDFEHQIPQPVKDCLSGNKELAAVLLKYGITNETDPATIERKALVYVALHFLDVHRTLGGINDNWKAGKYYEVGYVIGTLGHNILGSQLSIATPNPTDKEILQQGLNGLFEQNKLADSTTIVPCIDDATATKIVAFAGQILGLAAKGSPTDIPKIIQLIKDFGNQIPQPVKDCLDGNAELASLGLKYGITPTTDTSVIEKKVIAYVTLHYLECHKKMGDLNSEWIAAKYYQVGFDGAEFGHKILGITIAQIAQLRRSPQMM